MEAARHFLRSYPVSLAWLAVKLCVYVLLLLTSTQAVLVVYQQF
jgi:hypothetical protein